MIELGFRKLRYGQPIAGEHWTSGRLHYFVHQNQSNQMPMGMRKGVELIVLDTRLFNERRKDEFIQKTDVLFRPDSPSRSFLERQLGPSYFRLIDAVSKTQPDQQHLAQQVSREAMDLLRRASKAPRGEQAMLLLAANGLVAKLSAQLSEVDGNGDRESAAAGSVRTQLASFGVKLGGLLHDGGLAYRQDLLWRVWREFPDTEAGELAFVELQQRGWDTNPGIGCPTNPDLFHDVIEHGEAFLAQHPNTQFRKEILFTLAVANESWWSIAHAPAKDGWVAEIPYPRKDVNKQQSTAARERAVNYYREIVNLAPDSPEAASAQRRLPRLKLNLDTGQRRFFCSYC
jgi:hypothetical protein